MNDLVFSPAVAFRDRQVAEGAGSPLRRPAGAEAHRAHDRPPVDADAATPALAVTDLHSAFRLDGRWHPAVSGLSFVLHPGETLAIVGESGSGKSVSALSVMGLLPHATSRVQGSVKLSGRELIGLDEARMTRVRGNEIAMIFQEPMTSLNPVLKVGVQIAESLVFHRGLGWRDARAEAIRLLDRVRIPAAASRFDEFPHRFSGGMRQRAMIAMALACKPRVLIADEPTTALDVTIQAQILDLVKELQAEEGTAVLFITHDMGVVAEIADRMVVMYQGRAVESGPAARVFAQPSAPYTRALLEAVPRLGAMAAEPQPLPFALIDPVTGAMHPARRRPDTVQRHAPPILEVRGLSTRFDVRSGLFGRVSGRVHAVEDLSFSIQPGETLALVGESGCGKSTTGRSIMGLVPAQAGSIRIDGIDVLGLSGQALRDARRRAQMIFQDPYASLDPRQTIGAAIAEPLLAHGLATPAEAGAEVARLLGSVGLDPSMEGRYPHEFSGGQRQRISIARALALKPGLIIADEAVSALDVSIKAQIVNLLLEIQARLGVAYLFISHDMAVVERVAHRVAVMYLGEIVEIGPRAAVLGNPQHAYTQRLIAAVPVPDPAQRGSRRATDAAEVVNPLRPVSYAPPVRRYREVSPGHWVLDETQPDAIAA